MKIVLIITGGLLVCVLQKRQVNSPHTLYGPRTRPVFAVPLPGAAEGPRRGAAHDQQLGLPRDGLLLLPSWRPRPPLTHAAAGRGAAR